MPGKILTTTTTIQCTHGGMATLTTPNTKVFAGNMPTLLETDVHPVVGCPFTIGLKYSPCIRIEWSAGSTSAKVNGTPVLIQSSIGKCINAEGAPQGIAIISSTQIKASAR